MSADLIPIKDNLLLVNKYIKEAEFITIRSGILLQDPNKIVITQFCYVRPNPILALDKANWLNIVNLLFANNHYLHKILANSELIQITQEHQVCCCVINLNLFYILTNQQKRYIANKLAIYLKRNIDIRQVDNTQALRTDKKQLDFKKYFPPLGYTQLDQSWQQLIKYCNTYKAKIKMPYILQQTIVFMSYVQDITMQDDYNFIFNCTSINISQLNKLRAKYLLLMNDLIRYLICNDSISIVINNRKPNMQSKTTHYRISICSYLSNLLIQSENLEDYDNYKYFLSYMLRQEHNDYQPLIRYSQLTVKSHHIELSFHNEIELKNIDLDTIMRDGKLEAVINLWFLMQDYTSWKRKPLVLQGSYVQYKFKPINKEFNQTNIAHFVRKIHQYDTDKQLINILTGSEITFALQQQVFIHVSNNTKAKVIEAYNQNRQIEHLMNYLSGSDYHAKDIYLVGAKHSKKDLHGIADIITALFKHTKLNIFYTKARLYHYDNKQYKYYIFALSHRAFQYYIVNHKLVDEISRPVFEFFIGKTKLYYFYER